MKQPVKIGNFDDLKALFSLDVTVVTVVTTLLQLFWCYSCS